MAEALANLDDGSRCLSRSLARSKTLLQTLQKHSTMRASYRRILLLSVLLLGLANLLVTIVIKPIRQNPKNGVSLEVNALMSGQIDVISAWIRDGANRKAGDVYVQSSGSTVLERCKIHSNELSVNVSVSLNVTEAEATMQSLAHIVQPGGIYRPLNCSAVQEVAVVVPFRDREEHLKLFLAHMHPILMKQKLAYTIFVINQTDSLPFNRAMLMNVGYVEAKKRSAFDCFVFHDVDLLPENEHNIHTCSTMPRHLAVSVDKFNYTLAYDECFGGANALTDEHMRRINGFSNQFWGWGGEDDEIFERIAAKNMTILRYSPLIARYTMIRHNQSAINEDRFNVLNVSSIARDLDGLSNLEYVVHLETEQPLHTELHVELKKVEWNITREASYLGQ